MRTNLTLSDWLIVAVLIGVINLCVRWLDTPLIAEAQSNGEPFVAAAMSANGSKAVIVRGDRWMIINPSGMANPTTSGKW